MNYFIDIVFIVIIVCILVCLAFHWFLGKYVYRVRCELWKQKNSGSEKCLAMAVKRVLAKTPKQAKLKVEKELKKETKEKYKKIIELLLKKKNTDSQFNKILNSHRFEWFINGKQF